MKDENLNKNLGLWEPGQEVWISIQTKIWEEHFLTNLSYLGRLYVEVLNP